MLDNGSGQQTVNTDGGGGAAVQQSEPQQAPPEFAVDDATTTQPTPEPSQDKPAPDQQAPAAPAEPDLPDWLKALESTPPQPQQAPQSAQVAQLVQQLQQVIAQGQGGTPQQQAAAQAASNLLPRLLDDPASVLNETVAPIQQEVAQIKSMLEQQMVSQIAAADMAARRAMQENYREIVARDPDYASNAMLKAQVDRMAAAYMQEAVRRAAMGDPSHLEFLRSKRFGVSVLALAKAGLEASTPAAQVPGQAQPNAAAATSGVSPTGGSAAESAPKLPPGVGERELALARRLGITPEDIARGAEKYGWEG